MFFDVEVGLFGGGFRDKILILVVIYDSVIIYVEMIGNKYVLLVFDECYYLFIDFYWVIVEYVIFFYCFGFIVIFNCFDGCYFDLNYLIGFIVFSKIFEELVGSVLVDYKIV